MLFGRSVLRRYFISCPLTLVVLRRRPCIGSRLSNVVGQRTASDQGRISGSDQEVCGTSSCSAVETGQTHLLLARCNVNRTSRRISDREEATHHARPMKTRADRCKAAALRLSIDWEHADARARHHSPPLAQLFFQALTRRPRNRTRVHKRDTKL